MIRKFALIILIMSVAGCASTGPYQVSDNWDPSQLATVVLYRTSAFYHSLNPEKPFFYIDDQRVGKLGTGMEVTTKVQAGKHVLTVREPILFMPTYVSGRIEHEFEAGQTYYIRYSLDATGLRVAGNSIYPTGSITFSIADQGAYLEKR